MSTFYDALETRSTAEREAALMAALPQQIAHAQKASPAFASILAGVDAGDAFWAWAICCGSAAIKAASRSAGLRVSKAS